MGRIPWDIADAIILWGRNTGRDVTPVWHPVLDAPIVKIRLRPDDPRMKAWQEGDLEEEPFETVLLPNDLENYGATGIVEILQKGDLMSGRGTSSNLMSATVEVIERNRKAREESKQRIVKAIQEASKEEGLNYRNVKDLPQVSVPANIN